MSKRSALTAILILAGLATPGALPAKAADTLSVDYRNAAFRDGEPAIPAVAKTRIAKALATAPAEIRQALKSGFAILGEAKGPISGGKGEETAYLLSPKRPVAADPGPSQRQVIALVSGDKLVGAYLLPETGYARLVGTAPGSPGRALLLDGTFMNMGQTVTSLDAVTLGPGEATSVRQSVKDVYVDGCDNPAGERVRKAALVTVDPSSGTLTPAWQDLGCPATTPAR